MKKLLLLLIIPFLSFGQNDNDVLCLDGINDHIVIDQPNTFGIDSLYISLMVKLNSYPASGVDSLNEGMIFLIETIDANSRLCELYFNKKNNLLEFNVANQSAVAQENNMNINQWYAVQASYNNGQTSLYVDCELVSQNFLDNELVTQMNIANTGSFVIGSLPLYYDYFDGCIDNINVNINGENLINWDFEDYDEMDVSELLEWNEDNQIDFFEAEYQEENTMLDYTCIGCTDADACNYDNFATLNDGNCTYPETYYDCFGNCLNDFDNDLICNEIDNCPLIYNPNQNDFDNDAIGDACDGLSLNEENTITRLITTVNILGQETNNNKGFQLHIYDDGSVEKKYVIK